MTAEKKALRVRNSMARSFRAISQAPYSVSANCQRLPVGRRVRAGVDAFGSVVAHEPSALHYGSVSGERQTLGEIVGDDDDRGAGRPQLTEESGESACTAVVESAVRL